MEYTGNLVRCVKERSGEGQNGHWRINQYLLETVEMYPKKMVVDVRDNIELWDMLLGKNVTIKFSIDAHEWNGSWFNSIRAYAISEHGKEEKKQRSKHLAKPTGDIVMMDAPTIENMDEHASAEDGNGESQQGEDDLPF